MQLYLKIPSTFLFVEFCLFLCFLLSSWPDPEIRKIAKKCSGLPSWNTFFKSKHFSLKPKNVTCI